jgi:hypothetical protein
VLHPRGMKGFATVFPVMVLCSGCTALETHEEQTWLALHAVDAAQTYSIAGDRCYYEANPLTRSIIGREPSHAAVVGWAIGIAAVHVGVSDYLLRTDHPKLAKAWQYITIGTSAYSVGNNFSIGIRIGRDNKMPDACRSIVTSEDGTLHEIPR